MNKEVGSMQEAVGSLGKNQIVWITAYCIVPTANF